MKRLQVDDSATAAGTAALRQAVAADAAAIASLLSDAGLPAELQPGWFPARVVVAERAGAIVGAAAYEPAGDAALLRSVVVAPAQRGAGTGERLVRDRLAAMAANGCREAYLLTTGAAAYFARLGFARTDRAAAPAAVRQLEQFATMGCASAACMKRTLG